MHFFKLWRRRWKHVCLTAVGRGKAPEGRRLPQVWCVAVSAAGDLAVSGGADRSLRVWRRTDEPFFVEEERERRLESMFEADAEVRQAAERRLESMFVADAEVKAILLSAAWSPCPRPMRRCGAAAV